jgi:hypothetical protein
MTKPSYEAQQCAVHMVLGFIPVLKVRNSFPDKYGSDWVWSKWRYARISEVIAINSLLQRFWRD